MVFQSVNKVLLLLKKLIIPPFRRSFLKNDIEIHRTVNVAYWDNLKLSKYVYIGADCFINAEGGVEIGEGSILAPKVVILSGSHDYKSGKLLPFDVYDVLRPVKVGRGVWIGYGAMISPGVELGDGAVIAMGSVVVKNVKPGEVVGGNPARPFSSRDIDALDELLRERKFFRRFYPGNTERPREPSLRK